MSSAPAPEAAAAWYYVITGAPPVGPFDGAAIATYAAAGYFDAATTLFWKDGRPSWDKLGDIPELAAAVEAARAAAAAAPPAAAAPAAQAATAAAGAQGAAATPSAGAAAAAAAGGDDLDAFKAEIAAVEAEIAPPSPEEKEFEDDDGTMYAWDSTLRKFVEKDAAPGPSSAYNEADMVFEAEQEVIPTLRAALLQDELAEVVAAGGGGGNGNGRKRKRDNGGGADEDAGGEPGTSGGRGGNGGGRGGGGRGGRGGGRGGRKGKGGFKLLADKPPAAAGAAAGGGAEGEAAAAAGGEGGAAGGSGQQPVGWFELKNNSNIYVTGLPGDVTVEEVAELFAKCGIIKEDEQRRPRIKLYRDKATGMLKGDALVSFLKEPSVALACQIYDGALFRHTMGTPMTVTPAKFEMKAGDYKPKAAAVAAGGKGGGGKGRKQALEKLEKRLQWGGFDDKLPPEKVTVILHHMFSPSELSESPALAAEIESDVRVECGKLGAIEKVRLFKLHPEGIVSVKFKQAEPAAQCVAAMNGRWFGGQQILAHMWDGVVNYAAVKAQRSAEEEAARLEAFAREIEK